MALLLQKAKRFVLSDIYAAVVFLLAYAFVVFDCPVGGFCAMMTVLILVALLSDDMVPMVLPLLLLFCTSLLCAWRVNELEWLFWVFVPTAGGALLYRFLCGVKSIRFGRSFPGLVAVTVAVTLGGLFRITPEEYFTTASLYHVLGLGVMGVALYLVFKSNATVRRDYEVGDKIASAMYLMAIFLSFMVLRLLVMYPEILESNQPIAVAITAYAIWRNTSATLIVMAIPFVFYYARRHHPIHLLSAIFIYAVAVISGSRGGILIGGIELLLCFFAYIWPKRRLRAAAFFLIVGSAALALAFREPIIDFCETYLRLSFDENIIEGEARYVAIFRAIEDFASAPLFGTGLGYTGNADILDMFESSWRLHWYHSLFPQIIGSLGLCGLFAYGYQFYLRLVTLREMKRSPFFLALVLSYIGTLLYSQIDPGIFAPFPVAALLVLFFVIAECERDPQRVQRKTP